MPFEIFACWLFCWPNYTFDSDYFVVVILVTIVAVVAQVRRIQKCIQASKKGCLFKFYFFTFPGLIIFCDLSCCPLSSGFVIKFTGLHCSAYQPGQVYVTKPLYFQNWKIDYNMKFWASCICSPIKKFIIVILRKIGKSCIALLAN